MLHRNIQPWRPLMNFHRHYGDVIMGTIASQITSLTTVYSTVYSDADQRKHQSSTSLAFVQGIHREPVDSPHKWPVTRKMFLFDDVIMEHNRLLSLQWCDVSIRASEIKWSNKLGEFFGVLENIQYIFKLSKYHFLAHPRQVSLTYFWLNIPASWNICFILIEIPITLSLGNFAPDTPAILLCHIQKIVASFMVTSNGRPDISIHLPLDCLLSSLLRLTLKGISKLHITGSLWGESTSDWWIPLTKG